MYYVLMKGNKIYETSVIREYLECLQEELRVRGYDAYILTFNNPEEEK